MIEVKVKDEVQVEEELKYPVIMVRKFDGLKVLMTNGRSGFVLDAGTSSYYKVGQQSKNWFDPVSIEQWQIFTGTLEVSYDRS